MGNLISIFGGPVSAIEKQHIDPPEVQLADAMRSVGIEPPPSIKIDGQLHRFSTKGRKKDDSGWYVAFHDGIPAGRFGCWRDGVDVNWTAKIGRELSAAEQMALVKRQAEAKKLRDEERQRKREVAADTVSAIWEQAGPASPEHPYLARKGIKPHGARITGDGRLMVPLMDEQGELSSIQYISADGDKKYHPGGATGERCWMIGDPNETIYIAEGFATAATIHETTGEAVAIAYSASNIVWTTGMVRAQFGPNKPIVIVADNDVSGVGRSYADQASAKYGARVVMPPSLGDANDYAQAGNDLFALLHPPAEDWLIPADEFASKPAPISWLIKHWLQSSALIMVHGPSGGGKTFVVLDWCCSIAAGKPDWFEHKTKPGTVIYLAGEGHHGMKGRVAVWKQEKGQGNPLSMWISRDGCDLNTPTGYQRVVENIRATQKQPSLIVVDTLHRFLDGDENSAQDAKTMLDACGSLISEFACSVILVHHTGVSDEAQHRARGSSAWRGALDIEISVVPPKTEGGSISLVQRKSKDAELAEPMFLDLVSKPINGWLDEDGEQVTSAIIEPGAEPVKTTDKPTAKHQKTLDRAWFLGGCEIENGHPYITKSVLTELLEKDAIRKSTIKNYLKSSYDRGPIGYLINAEMIAPHAHGWIVIEPTWRSTMMIQKGG